MRSMLELLLAEDGVSDPPVVALQLAGRADEPVVTGLLERLPAACRRVFPAPDAGRAPAEVRAWYRDLWWALPASEQRAVAAAAGPGVACLAVLLDRKTRVVATVRDPYEALEAVAAAGARLPNRAALLALRDDPGQTPKPRLRAVANPQARELLLPWSEADELPVTVGPPPDADRWRELLFEQAVPRLQPAPIDPAPPPLPAGAGLPGKRTYHELLLALNWLDRELYASCGPG